MHLTEHLILVCMSVFFLSFLLSIHLLFCLSIHVNLFLINLPHIPSGYRTLQVTLASPRRVVLINIHSVNGPGSNTFYRFNKVQRYMHKLNFFLYCTLTKAMHFVF